MKRVMAMNFVLYGLLAATSLIFGLSALKAAPEKHAFTPEDIPYGAAPAFVAPGAQLAVIEGNPGACERETTRCG